MKILEVTGHKYNNWVFPDQETLQADFDEYKKKEFSKWQRRAEQMGFRFPIFDDFESFKTSLKNAAVIELDAATDRTIMNRSHTGSIESLKDLNVGSIERPVKRWLNQAPQKPQAQQWIKQQLASKNKSSKATANQI